MKVVMDTNVFVSSLLSPKGLPADLLRVWLAGGYELIVSPSIINEIRRVLSYEHIRTQFPITDPKVDEFIRNLERHAVVIATTEEIDAQVAGAIPADPDDEIILACALAGEAMIIISGDKHLLKLGEYAGIPIISARQFWDRFGFWQS